MINQTVTIADIASVNGGKRLPKGHELLTTPTNHLYIRARDIGGGKIEIKEPVYIADSTFQKISRYTVKKNDLAITIVGVNIGDVGIVDEEYDGANLTENASRVRTNPELCDPKFLLSQLSTQFNKYKFQQIAAGAAQGKLGLFKIKSFKVALPKIDIQKKIADIYITYTFLIENNFHRIQLLEESAQLLFREWFVYFKFPGHKKKKLVDGVPEGWKKEKIDKFVTFKRGVEPGSDNYLEVQEQGSFPFFRVSDLVIRKPSIFVDEQYAKKAFIKKIDIVVSLDGSVGIVSIGLEGCYSTGVRKLVIKDKKVNRPYLYFLMKSHYIQGIINAYAKGTTIQHAGEAIKHMEPLFPTQDIMDLFGDIVNPILDEILVLFEENHKLTQARDLLLPRLMSGEIEV